VKLPHLDGWNAARRGHADRYRSRLAAHVRTPTAATDREHIYHLYVIEVDERDRMKDRLRTARIDSGIHYPVPVHLQEACRSLGYHAGDFPVAEHAARRILSLPMFPELTDARIDYVSEAVIAALR
jgi:dTDP-4-amino-4,6-dideoxygalactose transaminase